METANLDEGELENIKTASPGIFDLIKEFFARVGINTKDGKIEGGFTYGGEFITADGISPDELRLEQNGRRLDKDPLRLWYEVNEPEWYIRLMKAKELFPRDKSKWPTYEAVPPKAVIDKFIEGYRVVAESIGAI